MAPPPKPTYGLDAPGVMAGLLSTGAALLGAATWLNRRRRGPIGTSAAIVAGAAGGGAALFGSAMLAYGLTGKFRIRDIILDAIDWRGDEQVLDVGTGLGLLAIGAAHRLSSGRVTAIDIWQAKDLSSNSIDIARQNAQIEGLADNVVFEHRDARHLPDPDASYDVIISLLCLHNIEPAADRSQACREMARVLKPGGRVIVGDYVSTRDYASVFADGGLTIRSTRRYYWQARGLMWLTIADKPA